VAPYTTFFLECQGAAEEQRGTRPPRGPYNSNTPLNTLLAILIFHLSYGTRVVFAVHSQLERASTIVKNLSDAFLASYKAATRYKRLSALRHSTFGIDIFGANTAGAKERYA